MLWSQLALQTFREDNHPLLVRAGYIRDREYTVLGQRSLAKIESALREEQDRGGALARCGVKFVQAGDAYAVESCSGDDVLVRGQDYAALLGHAVSVPRPAGVPDVAGDFTPEEFPTPGVKTIAQIAQFSGLPPTSQIKSLALVRNGEPLLVLLRGDHQLNPAKLPGARPAEADEIRRWFGADAGSLGPVGLRGIRILADDALRGRRNLIAGANRNGFHLRHVTPGEDFVAEYADLREAAERDTSVTGGPLTFSRGTVLKTAGDILQAAASQNQDQDGLALPAAIAPFSVIVTPVHPERLPAAREIYERLLSQGVDVLLDDRDVRPGVKFKDADLIGIPYRINVGKKFHEGLVELVERAPRTSSDVPAGEINIPR